MITLFKDFCGIVESKQVGTIYHFTSLKSFVQIVSGNNEFDVESFDVISSNNKTVSFTRNPSAYLYGDLKVLNPQVRITVDGNKLSSKYKIKPVRGKLDGSDPFKSGERVDLLWQESEEAVLVPKYGNINIKRFVKSVEIKNREGDNPEVIDYLKKTLEKQGITFSYGRKAFHKGK